MKSLCPDLRVLMGVQRGGLGRKGMYYYRVISGGARQRKLNLAASSLYTLGPDSLYWVPGILQIEVVGGLQC